jgi:hypothetical protein
MERLGVLRLGVLRERLGHVLRFFAAERLSFVDLSLELSNAHFADRWCACGHLLDSGRLHVVDKIMSALPRSARPVRVD